VNFILNGTFEQGPTSEQLTQMPPEIKPLPRFIPSRPSIAVIQSAVIDPTSIDPMKNSTVRSKRANAEEVTP